MASNGKGRLTKVTYQNQGAGQVLYSYDELGRVIESTRQIDGQNYTIDYAYDALSRLTSLIYPNNKEVRYAYNSNSGQPETVYDPNTSQTYVSNVNYNTAGQVTRIDLGNNKTVNYVYDPETLRMVGNITSTVQDLAYTYDSLGQITRIDNGIDENATEIFEYDEFNRLKSANGRYGAKNYTFDKIGNITSKDNLTYTYGQYSPGEGENVHSPVSLSDGTAFVYDQNSNLLFSSKSGVTTQYTYDIDNNLRQVVKYGTAKAVYEYDGEGARTKKTSYATGFPVPLVSPQTTYYIDGLYEAGSSGLQVNHIYLGGRRIASVKNGQAEYYLTDHLGGTTRLLDAAGNVVEKIEYDPYGSVSYYQHPGTNSEKAFKYYTGQEFDGEVGLYYYGARHYDPALGRFLQADSVVQDPMNPQTFNRHSYTSNNPVNRIDPSGNVWTSPDSSSDDNDKPDESGRDAGGDQGDAGGMSGGDRIPTLPEVVVQGKHEPDTSSSVSNPDSFDPDSLSALPFGADQNVVRVSTGLTAEQMATFIPTEGLAFAIVGSIGKLGNNGLKVNKLFKNALQQFKNTKLTNAGRALTKHPGVVGETADSLRKSLRLDPEINKAAAEALKTMMRESSPFTSVHPRFGNIITYRLESGYGARFSTKTNEFIGFINPKDR